MSYGTSIAAPLPTPEVTVGPDYAQILRTWCDEVEARLEGKVTPAGFNSNAALEMNDFEITEIDAAQFKANTVDKTGAGNARKVYVKDGELFFTDGDGTTIQLTLDGALNTGGGTLKTIEGDYTGDAAASVDYTTGSTRYRLLSNDSTIVHARGQMSDLRLVGTGANPSLGVTVDVPALGAGYNLTLPAAVPAATELVSMTTGGDLAANGKHGDRTFAAHACAGFGTAANVSPGNGYVVSSGAGEWWIPLPLKVGDQLKSLILWGDDSGSSLSVTVYRVSSAGVRNLVAGPSAAPGSWGSTAALTAINHDVLVDNAYYARIPYTAASTEFAGVQGVFWRP